MLQIIKEVRDINRFKHILIVLFEEGFDFLIAKIGLRKHVPLSKRIKTSLQKSKEEKLEVRLRKTLERLGPTFIKLGQLLSVRPDVVPKNLRKELEKLQDNVDPIQFADIKKILERELGKKISQVFKKIDQKPIASASISQVHNAVLKNGETVAVKVQRDDTQNLMRTDIDIMFYFAKLLERHIEGIRMYNPVRVVSEFKEWTDKELDFRLEARNAQVFYKNFAGSKKVAIPRIYEELTTQKVLVSEFMDGVEVHNVKELKRRKLNLKKIFENGFDAIMTQVFVHGVFHADPHPGNIIVRKDNSIAFVDFGIVGYFDDKLKNKCIDLLYGIVEKDEEMVLETFLSLGMPDTDLNYEELKADIGFAIRQLQGTSIEDIKLSRVLEQVLEIGLKHRLKVPLQFVLFGKTIVTLEGIALEYDPNFKIIETTRPFVEKLIRQRLSPMYAWKNLVHNMNKYRRFIEDFPDKAEKAFDKIQRGTVKVDIDDKDIKKLAQDLDRSSNRVAYGLLVTALLITSALLLQIEKGPFILGVPMLSFFSFIFASLLVFVLFFSIIREKIRHL